MIKRSAHVTIRTDYRISLVGCFSRKEKPGEVDRTSLQFTASDSSWANLAGSLPAEIAQLVAVFGPAGRLEDVQTSHQICFLVLMSCFKLFVANRIDVTSGANRCMIVINIIDCLCRTSNEREGEENFYDCKRGFIVY